jgi:protein TonB
MQKSAAKTAAAMAAPAAAQAGKTLTAADDADSGLEDFTMVQGTGTEYVGGTTSSIGTNQQAVRGVASDKPAPQKAVVSKVLAPAAAMDASERPRPLGNDWNCSRLFPSDPEAGDSAAVILLVTVGLDGSPKSVTVLKEPGHGFGAAARACAMTQRFSVGRDRTGAPVVSTTPPVTVRFTR